MILSSGSMDGRKRNRKEDEEDEVDEEEEEGRISFS